MGRSRFYWSVSLSFLMSTEVAAQFYGNAIPAELFDLQAGSVWFGSVRSNEGDFISDATVVLDTGFIEYVAVTGTGGRFRMVLPENTVPSEVTFSCAKAGFSSARSRLRRPSKSASTSIELSCIVR